MRKNRDHTDLKHADSPESLSGVAPGVQASSSVEVVPAQTTVLQDLASLGLKILLILGFFAILFTVVFGLFRYSAADMEPSVRDGDLVMIYRLDKSYNASELLAYENDGRMCVARVIAVEGETVDIRDGSVLVNGGRSIVPYATDKTERFQEGVSFPLKVAAGQVFVLTDARESSTDSRILGCLDAESTSGQVISVLRRRNL